MSNINEYKIQYPLDANELLRKKRAIKRSLSERNGLLEKKIAILGGSTTAEIKEILEIFLLNRGLRPRFYDSEYNKYFEDIIFDNPELIKFEPDLIFIHTTNVNISRWPSQESASGEAVLHQETTKFESLWDKIERVYGCPVIQNNFDPPVHRPLGNLEAYDPNGCCHFVNQLNLKFAEEARKRKNLFLHDINWLAASVGLSRWRDLNLWYGYKYAIAFDAIPAFANNLASIICSIFGLTRKCLVLDLDNTLWGGVIGDDGIGGIEIGNETPIAEAHRDLQAYAKRLKDRGVILAVASKNERSNAIEGLNHPENLLKPDDFATIEAHWDPKNQSLRKISEKLNIGINSLVFLDDNPAEREIVSANEPSVCVPNIGSNIAEFVSILDATGEFEPVSISEEDRSRARMYLENNAREKVSAQYTDYNDYLKSLEMVAHIQEFTDVHMERVAQLTNKTNQFNLTTRRYSLADISSFAKKDTWITLQGRLKDRFGDNGIVSVVTGEISGDNLRVDLWLMSCRVLKRNMEQAMLDRLTEAALKKGVKAIVGEFIPTAKNAMVANFFGEMGFEKVETMPDGSTKWFLQIDNYLPANRFIEVKSHE